ncbi:MAG: four helix bundle protein [Bacteroidales bacterium]|nr:four helix bundle protein [Bacteroidales bacterium]
MKVKSYKELLIWQKAMQITKEVYLLVKKLPKEETYALSDQIRRSAVSIPSNIAEGQERNSTTEFIRFLHIAQGSRAELETQLNIGCLIGYFDQNDVDPIIDNLTELGKMTNSLINTVKEK